MKRYLLFIVVWAVIIPQISAQTSLKERLKKHVYTLAADSLKGRKADSPESRKAAAYIVEQWKEIGIEPFFEDSYYQDFNIFQNIIGILHGNDPELRNEYIVIGAHYDHLGVKVRGEEEVIYNGADDNASGTASLIELARKLKAIQAELQRSIILVAFDAEELGLLGSTYFINSSIVPLEQIKLMLSLDMIGWYQQSGYIEYQGTGTIENGETQLLDEKIVPKGLNVKTKPFETKLFSATDTYPFAQQGIPTLAVTTGLDSPYHKPEDTADLIDYDGMALITNHLTNYIRSIAQNADYHSSGALAAKHKPFQKPFLWGVSANIGSNYHKYTAGALQGKQAGAFGIGLLSQINMKIFALRPEVYYEYLQAQHPEGKITANRITIPFSFVLQNKNSLYGVDVFLGAYYSHAFNGSQSKEALDFTNTFYRNEGGVNYGFGLRLAKFKIQLTRRDALTNFTRNANEDDAFIRNRASYFTVVYLF
jgi:hypothetical protein